MHGQIGTLAQWVSEPNVQYFKRLFYIYIANLSWHCVNSIRFQTNHFLCGDIEILWQFLEILQDNFSTSPDKFLETSDAETTGLYKSHFFSY